MRCKWLLVHVESVSSADLELDDEVDKDWLFLVCIVDAKFLALIVRNGNRKSFVYILPPVGLVGSP